MKKVLFKNQIVGAVQNKRKGREVEYSNEERRPLIECVALEMEENEFLRDFFVVLSKHIQRIRRARGSEYEREARKIHEQIQKFAKKRAEIVEKLKASGIKINENILGPVYSLSEFDGGSIEHPSYRFNYADRFNDVVITLEMLQNPNDTTYRDSYETEKVKNVERAERLKELKKQLRMKTSVGRLTTDRETIEKQIKDLKSEIFTLEWDIDNERFYARDARVFESLTEEQRKLIIIYLEATAAIEKGVDAFKKCREKFEQAKPSIDSTEVLEEAFERMQANGMIEEDVERVMQLIDEIVHKRKLGVYEKSKSISTGRRTTEMAFLSKVYGFDDEREIVLMSDNIIEFPYSME